MSYLSLIGRNDVLFSPDVSGHEEALSSIIGRSRFLIIGGSGSIGQAVTREIFKRDPKALHVVDISENNMVMLKQVLVILNANASASIVLSGHTDNSGAEKFNQKLSLQRADEVKNYLVENGIDESRLKAIGQGESSPRASNDTLEGRGLNRRVDFNVE